MRFISPKTDFAFKKIFGSNKSKDILISFLNAIVYQGNQTIQDLEIINPYNPPATPILKDSYLDVRAVLDNQSKVIIEMQVINVEAFEKRIVYNLAKTYSNQLKSGQGYSHLQPVIALTIVDFEMFENNSDVITFWTFREVKKLIKYPDETLKMVFVELPKFKQKLEELETISDKWIYFIKEAPSLEMIPKSMEKIKEIKQALNIANLANFTEEELDELHHQEVYLEDQRGSIIRATREALEVGRQSQIKLIVNILEGKLGKIPTDLLDSLQNFSEQQLQELSVVIANINSFDDLNLTIENLK